MTFSSYKTTTSVALVSLIYLTLGSVKGWAAQTEIVVAADGSARYKTVQEADHGRACWKP